MTDIDIDAAAANEPITLPADSWRVSEREYGGEPFLALVTGEVNVELPLTRDFIADLRGQLDRGMGTQPVDRGAYRLAWGDPDAPDLHLTVRNPGVVLEAPLRSVALEGIQWGDGLRQVRVAKQVMLAIGWLVAILLGAAVVIYLFRAY